MKKFLFVTLAVLMAFAMVGLVSCGDKGNDGGGGGGTAYTIEKDLNWPTDAVGTNPGNPASVSTDKSTKKLTTAQLSAPAGAQIPANYEFDDWYTTAAGNTKVTTNTAFSANGKIFAHWNAKALPGEVVVNFNTQGGGVVAAVRYQLEGDEDIGYTPAPIPADKIPADPTKILSSFIGWFEDAEGGAVLNLATKEFAEGTHTIYAQWNYVPVVEKVTLKNSWFVVYRFELPEGGAWENYSTIKAQYQLDQTTITSGVPRAIRLLGNYKESHFSFYDGLADTAGAGKNWAMLNYNTIGNNAFIMNQLGSSWDAGFNAELSKIGVTAVADEWFTLTYPTNGTGANATFDMNNIPDGEDEGPFYFGIGLPGQDNTNTFLVQDVRLVGITRPDGVKYDDVIGTPCIFKDPDNVEYAPFVGYGSPNGNDGYAEAKREILSGMTAAEVPVINVVYVKYTVTKNPNYPTEAIGDKPAIDAEETDKNAYLDNDQLTALPKMGSPTPNGSYVFKGWYTAPSEGRAVSNSTKFTANTTIYGQWNHVIKPTPIAALEIDNPVFAEGNTPAVLGQGSGAIAIYPLPAEAIANAYSTVKVYYTVTGYASQTTPPAAAGALKLIFKAAGNGLSSDWSGIQETYEDITADNDYVWEHDLIDGFTHLKIQDNSGGGAKGTVTVTKIEITAENYRAFIDVAVPGVNKVAVGDSWDTMFTINTAGDGIDIADYSAYIIQFKMYDDEGEEIDPADYGPGKGNATPAGLSSTIMMKFSAKKDGANDAAIAATGEDPAVPAAVPVYNVGDRFNGGNGPNPDPNAVLSGVLLSLPYTGNGGNSFEGKAWTETDVIKCITFQRSGSEFNTDVAEFEIISIKFYVK
jgi:hypothetical protein